MSVKTPQDVRDFWFSDQMQPFWFKKSDDIDRQIIQLFGETYEAAHAGRLKHWLDGPEDALALGIVLDQFPRNMFRGSARSFESNDLALTVARQALADGHDQQLDPTRRQFLYLPFMHSEDLQDQERSVSLYEALGNEHSLHFAREHRDIVARFGRFPHRNAVLGRENTPEETEFLKTHDGF
ncbi:DUF924 domain-containing protein [Paracoccus sp. R12_1]|uniref:DUF924 family protein n=1 Tax=unclassified Paracoccus (in: a-proteobacteria) TaxID=2688777 RepID=UPI001ADCACF3|nr:MULTISPECIES: DUF924 family protein [unclassified Paracoccus (in: a-proteobacteria)]MBO9456338.1 DUF924 domain-containing protein [Paracoccus sp. R12_2]MBO9487547.1 DUF924 domain-containing protein [Paracoccus sp. R12_1]